MKIPKFARYEYCYKRALDFISKYEITSYPVDPFKIIKKEKYGLMKYSELVNLHNCSLDDVKNCFGNDGYSTLELLDGKEIYSIAYNDKSECEERIRFTLMHELGHIFLHHLKNFDVTKVSLHNINAYEYQILEKEANAFARNVLAPAALITHMKNKNPKYISSVFGISVQAAEARMDFLEIDINNFEQIGFDDILLSLTNS